MVMKASSRQDYWKGVWQRIFSSSSISLLIFILAIQLLDLYLVQTISIHTDTWPLYWTTIALPLLALAILIPALIPFRTVRSWVVGCEVFLVSLLFIWEYSLLTEKGTSVTDTVMMQFLFSPSEGARRELLPWGISIGQGFRAILWLLFFAVLAAVHRPLIRVCKYFITTSRYSMARRIGTLVIIFSACLFFAPYSCSRRAYSDFYINDDQLSMPERFFVATKQAMNERLKLQERMDQMNSISLDPIRILKERPPHNVVLIIGESLRSVDMQCYGYPLKTTPRLDSMAKAGHLILYDDVVTCAPSTDESLKSVLTYHNALDTISQWYEFPSIHQVFKSANYKTYHTSTQERGGAYLGYVTAITNIADSTAYTTLDTYGIWRWGSVDSDKRYDEDILPLLVDYRDFGSPLFTTVQLFGSHEYYKDRYPEQYEHFTADSIIETQLNDHQKIMSAYYLNSILYNDYVVDQIFRRYADTSSIVIYFSDHGQVRYDAPGYENSYGHGATENAMRIPFMVYMSPQFIEENPDIYEAVLSARHRPFMTDMLTPSLVALMGITNRFSNPAFELWGESFDATRPREFHGWRTDLIFTSKY
ncbi:hypothetical protein HQ45_07210 [Porphyromonas crevioricanis]|uniref:Phosphoethanolamine transferase CptA n=2 Tax=Porphyromonas crevioricanis TaxID=393921 RepID=A0A0A2FE58_9PORP|nr:hypothetical protein HQ45_07210 [Porphyromonas crevioricanis]SQH73102.1 Phosphoethanolamine transferase CptA [Porphyromonas crevioricanis]